MLLALAASATAVVLTACGQRGEASNSTMPPAPADSSTPSPMAQCGTDAPSNGVLFGVNLDWGNDSIEAYSDRLGQTPAVFVLFAEFPMDEAAKSHVREVAGEIAANRGSLMLTLEPHGGLNTVTPESAAELARYLREINDLGTPVYLRFAHEMNGSWYTWSQAPTAYISAYREVAQAVHAEGTSTAMVWAPNYGGGYPFIGGKYAAMPGTAAYSSLDTDGDGAVTMLDDPYEPYYPGDDVVDWVGMSLYHWGTVYPWGENELPEPDKFLHQLTGQYTGGDGSEHQLPDFYATFGVGHGKPVAITETAAFYRPSAGGVSGYDIKRNWWRQVFSVELSQAYSQVKMINWFEWAKYETEVQDDVDWTVTNDPALLSEFLSDLPPYLRFAGGTC